MADPSLEMRQIPQHSPRSHFKPVSPPDYEALRLTELSEALGPRWRHKGRTPSPEEFASTLWSGITAQFIVVASGNGEPVGVVACYGADHQNQHAYLAAARFRKGQSIAFSEGLVTFVDYVFSCWPFRKLYVEVAEYNLGQILPSLQAHLVEEGVMKGHLLLDDRVWDQHVFALWRRDWRTVVEHFPWLKRSDT